MRFLTYLPFLLFAIMLATASCSDRAFDDEKDIEEDTTVTDTIIEEEPTATEILTKKWRVAEAYVNQNTPDYSSEGLTFDVFFNGSYHLSTGYDGTWRFNEDETHIIWDEGTSYEQDFELIQFDENIIEANFKSAFTKQRARWILKPL